MKQFSRTHHHTVAWTWSDGIGRGQEEVSTIIMGRYSLLHIGRAVRQGDEMLQCTL